MIKTYKDTLSEKDWKQEAINLIVAVATANGGSHGTFSGKGAQTIVFSPHSDKKYQDGLFAVAFLISSKMKENMEVFFEGEEVVFLVKNHYSFKEFLEDFAKI